MMTTGALLAGSLVLTPAMAQSGGNQWLSAGQNPQNTRYQSSETKITPANVHSLLVKWIFATGGDVSATPAVDGGKVYFPDWAGNLYAVDRRTGQQVWQKTISSVTGIAGDKARATPVVTTDRIVVGTQGTSTGGGGKMIAFNKDTGAVLWMTTLDSHPATIITQSATVSSGRVYVGTASQEEGFARDPTYPCCSFRGSMLALDLATGAILWKTLMVPAGYSGGAVWGSSPAVDPRRGQMYIATGNNYSIPPAAQACVAAAGNDPEAQKACIAADNHIDSVLALDVNTGAIRWATAALPFDAWTTACLTGEGGNCPAPAGPDYDFGQEPALFTVVAPAPGKPSQLVGAGQKSGQYWALHPDTGAVQWVTQAGPGGTAGGLQWGSAVDGTRVYTANANSGMRPWTLPNNVTVTSGIWSALNAATGQILWQAVPLNGGSTSGPVTTANGVVFGCSLDPAGYMYALDAATGATLWSYASGGSCLSGAAISNGMLFWGSGYAHFGFGTPNNQLYAFGMN